jgi:hypothetical protein
MQLEVLETPANKEQVDNSLPTQAGTDQPEYCVEEGWTEPIIPGRRGLGFRIPDSRHYGRCFPFLYWQGEPLCLIGPDWMFSVGLMIGFLFVFNSFQRVLVQQDSSIAYALFIIVQTAFLGSFSALAVKNPGVKSQSRSLQFVEETL